MDYTIVHGQTVSKYRCETICLKDFELSNKLEGGCSKSLVRNIAEGYTVSVWCDSKCSNFGLNNLCLVKNKHYF